MSEEGIKCKCGSEFEMEFSDCHDNPFPSIGKPCAFNVYICRDCGMVLIHHVWGEKKIWINSSGEKEDE